MLKPCAECGEPVSTHALACPHCGYAPTSRCEKCVFYSVYDPDSDPPFCWSEYGGCPAFVLDSPLADKIKANLGRKKYVKIDDP